MNYTQEAEDLYRFSKAYEFLKPKADDTSRCKCGKCENDGRQECSCNNRSTTRDSR